jgi:hypothetical protein
MAGTNGTPFRRTIETGRKAESPDVFRVLDWTKLDSAPSLADVKRLTSMAGANGAVRLAILVNTPRMLAAANVFAEQATSQGAQVRVFIDAKEALGWLYKDVAGLVQPF